MLSSKNKGESRVFGLEEGTEVYAPVEMKLENTIFSMNNSMSIL